MFILKNNLSLRIVRQMRRGFGTWCTNSYTSEKTPSRRPLDASTGRSMVEMLGVLAIIGVLSVGAIAGYSKAMMKYKLNKQAEQLNTVINAVARNIHGFDNLKGSDDANQFITSYFIKMGEFPKEMIISGDNDRIYDIWKNKYFIALTPKWIAIYVFMN